MSRRHSLRVSLICFALAALIILVWVTSASAYTIVGGDSAHRGAVASVLDSKPALVDYVESVWPLSVRVNYGGHAFPGGRMDVTCTLWSTAFTAIVAHELGHMVQLAADAEGGYPAIAEDWLQLLRDRGFPDSVWHWGGTYDHGHYDPWECFTENLSRAYYAPYYTGRTTPNTCLVWLSRSDMTAFLLAHGCDPYAR